MTFHTLDDLPSGFKKPHFRDLIIARIRDKSAPAENGCVVSTYYQEQSGYARIKVLGRNLTIHRLMYLLERGPIPDGYEIDHLCRNRLCFNVAHLEAVTAEENRERALRVRANWSETHCKRGHEYTDQDWRRGVRDCKTCERDRRREYNRSPERKAKQLARAKAYKARKRKAA